VMIVDTDEVWDTQDVKKLRSAIEVYPQVAFFRSRIWTYVKSPSYVVWPQEANCPVVALQTPKIECKQGRFSGTPIGHVMNEISFHHFSYVRDDPADIREKFLNTSSQEKVASKGEWLDAVWPDIPLVTNFHMTRGAERCWPGVKIVPPTWFPTDLRFSRVLMQSIQRENEAWRRRLRKTPPGKQLVPQPTWDRTQYGNDLQSYFRKADLRVLESRMQTSYLESLWLAYWASRVPTGGHLLEIGCGHGTTTTILAKASAAGATVHAVDPFLPYDEQALTLVRNVMEGDEPDFWDTIRQYRCKGKVFHIKCLASEARPHLAQGGYDFALVDANHSYEYAMHDMLLAWPRVKPGGVMAVHDYTTRFPGVIRAADELFPDADGPDRRASAGVAAGTSLFYVCKEA